MEELDKNFDMNKEYTILQINISGRYIYLYTNSIEKIKEYTVTEYTPQYDYEYID